LPPGVSGNPSGSYRSRPFTAAVAAVAEMEVQDLRPKPTDKVAVATTKVLALEAMKGKVPAYQEMADRLESKPGTRTEDRDEGAPHRVLVRRGLSSHRPNVFKAIERGCKEPRPACGGS
jgi:hypothetical protein